MSSLLTELTQRARQLPPDERAQLAEDLLDSLLEMPESEIEAAWDAEILRRINEYERGDAHLVSAEDVFAEARRLTT
jgi:putative addiction module component (TIGR02574 family)